MALSSDGHVARHRKGFVRLQVLLGEPLGHLAREGLGQRGHA